MRRSLRTCAFVLAFLAVGCGARSGLTAGQTSDGGAEAPRPEPRRFVDLAAGAAHSCAVTDGGTVVCWGSNGRARLGLSRLDTAAHPPTPIPGLTDVTRVSVNSQASCVTRSDGSVWCWGGNEGHTFEGERGRTVRRPQRIAAVDDATDVSVGNGHACVTTGGGSIQCWGTNSCGQLGHSAQGSRFVAPARAEGITDAAQVSAGSCHTCARRGDGSLRCWGSNSSGQLGAPGAEGSPVAPPVQGVALDVAAGAGCTCSTGPRGAHCWGSGLYGALGQGDTRDRASPAPVAGVGPSVHIATDCGATCVAEQNGTVRCWGLGGFGVLGQPEEGQQLTAVAHSEVQDAVQIEAGKEHMCARLEDGRIQCWGRNQHGQLGNGRQQDEGELTTIDPNELEI